MLAGRDTLIASDVGAEGSGSGVRAAFSAGGVRTSRLPMGEAGTDD